MNENPDEYGHPQGNESISRFAPLPSFPPDAEKAGSSELVCDECERANSGTASYSVLHIIFLLLIVVWRVDPVFKCPRCMRAYLLQRLPLSLIMATVFAPIIIIWWGVLFIRTLGR